MKTQVTYSIEDQDRLGSGIAEMLCLKRDPNNKDRWATTWGNKTNTGIFNTILRLSEDIATGEIENTLRNS